MVTGPKVSTDDPLRVLPETQVHTNIFIGELVGQTHALGLVLDRLAVHDGVFELLNDRLVDRVTLIFG
jgi:hypothetical protein